MKSRSLMGLLGLLIALSCSASAISAPNKSNRFMCSVQISRGFKFEGSAWRLLGEQNVRGLLFRALKQDEITSSEMTWGVFEAAPQPKFIAACRDSDNAIICQHQTGRFYLNLTSKLFSRSFELLDNADSFVAIAAGSCLEYPNNP